MWRECEPAWVGHAPRPKKEVLEMQCRRGTHGTMPDDVASSSGGKMDRLSGLREATGAAHVRLDVSFGSLDLISAAGETRFLVAHAIGVGSLYGDFSRFCRDTLEFACPDYPDMLRLDLLERGIDTGALPRLDFEYRADDKLASCGIAYVMAGSRLGMALIRRAPYWGKLHGHRSRYMEDERGHAVWKAMVPLLRAETVASQANAAAISAFDLFSRAFDASAHVAEALRTSPRAADDAQAPRR